MGWSQVCPGLYLPTRRMRKWDIMAKRLMRALLRVIAIVGVAFTEKLLDRGVFAGQSSYLRKTLVRLRSALSGALAGTECEYDGKQQLNNEFIKTNKASQGAFKAFKDFHINITGCGEIRRSVSWST